MGKRKSKSDSYTSKGERRSVAKQTTNAVRREYMASADRMLNQQKAELAGKRVVYTVENPSKEQTNQKFIKVVKNDNPKAKKH